ncbi:MAG: hypothetical protein AMJ69_10155 [Gammaproteobacteria bacterium SG8_47]|nr:MAG: hypothetical protein AMJ69_10155 [Gammaproteobacteria bacterium SG8_47]
MVNSYYSSQAEGDWGKTYELRSPEFQKMVERDYYLDQMAKDAQGWQLLSYDIDSFEERGGLIHILIVFRYRIDAGEGPANVEFLDRTSWVKSAGRWYSYNAGIQRHLPLNDSISR